MRPRHYWDSESDLSNSSSSSDTDECIDHHDQADLIEDDFLELMDREEQEGLNRVLYDNTGSVTNSMLIAAGTDLSSAAQSKQMTGIIRGVDQLTSLTRELFRLLFLIAQRIWPLVGTVVGLGLLHFYLFRAIHLSDIASHWAAVIGLTSTGFKAGLCATILLLCFARLATGFARQAAAARALSEADFDTAVWHMRLELEQGHSLSSISRSLHPKKLSYFIGAKWATATMRMKKFVIAMVTMLCVAHHCTIIIDTQQMRPDVLHCIFSVAFLLLSLCLFSTDLLAVQWGCVIASCLLYYLLQLAFYKLQNSAHRFEQAFPSLLAFRDALDFVPRLDLDRLGWQSGNTGCGPDFISLLITVLLDGVCIGVLHDINAISSLVRLFSVCGGNFIGLTGVEVLAMLGTEFMAAPCVILLLFPYLRRLSESEAAFVCTVMLHSATASTDRRFAYFGVNREKFLLQAVVLRQMSILSTVPICKVLYPLRTKLYVSCAGFQQPGKAAAGSIFYRVCSGALDGLRLATLVSKVTLIAKLSTIILCLMIDALFHYLSCITNSIVTIRQAMGFLLKPFLFLFCETKESLDWHSLLVAEILTFKTENFRIRLSEAMDSHQVQLVYNNLTGAALQDNWRTNLLVARHLYEPESMSETFEDAAGPFFSAYMVGESGSLIEHAIFINIFFFHCLTGSRVTAAMTGKMAAASLVSMLINTRLMQLMTVGNRDSH
ncbi:hypothetical protein BOX15_Mlig011653g1 [Macrostomum lignano]|uniref:Uncharacterized protein n=1 Tax=Macrostomum lignano TaxID=282301 RepID=A0A267GWN5_9PLAT|nr:hypothetical protein BOX15_Mlig011653g1 [Macrostomum lignano]